MAIFCIDCAVETEDFCPECEEPVCDSCFDDHLDIDCLPEDDDLEFDADLP